MEEWMTTLESPAPPRGLAKRILLCIERKERQRCAAKTAAFGLLCSGSIALIVYGSIELVAEASRSGFLLVSSLLFSDFSATVSLFFSDFMLSVVESFPVFSVVLLLSGVFFAIWSAANFLKEVGLMRGHMFVAHAR